MAGFGGVLCKAEGGSAEAESEVRMIQSVYGNSGYITSLRATSKITYL